MPVAVQSPVIITRLCTACGLCVDVCPTKVLELVEDLHLWTGSTCRVARPQDCKGCRLCEYVCPHFALNVVEVEPEASLALAGGRR